MIHSFLFLLLLISCHDSYYDPADRPMSQAPPPETSERIKLQGPSTGFDTGVPECVKSVRGSVEPLTPANINLETFSSLDALDTVLELTDLYDLLLREVVNPQSGLVDYDRLAVDYAGLWGLLMNAVREVTSPVGQGALSKAYWINIYNILMIEAILQESGKSNVSNLAGGNFAVFNKLFEVGSRWLSLNDIERAIILGRPDDQDMATRTLGLDLAFPYYESHVALVCGAISCPKLRNFAYRAENIDEVIEENFFIFFNDDRLYPSLAKISSLFNWYWSDWIDLNPGSQSENPVPLAKKYLLNQCDVDISTVISDLETKPSDTEYFWNINRQ